MFLREELRGNSTILIQYRWNTINNYKERYSEFDSRPGLLRVEKFSSRQKFYGNTSLQECPRDALDKWDGKKIIHIGNITFMDAQLYVIKSSAVMRLKDSNGLLLITVPYLERRRILKHIGIIVRRK
jgi:hypothetical protein